MEGVSRKLLPLSRYVQFTAFGGQEWEAGTFETGRRQDPKGDAVVLWSRQASSHFISKIGQCQVVDGSTSIVNWRMLMTSSCAQRDSRVGKWHSRVDKIAAIALQ